MAQNHFKGSNGALIPFNKVVGVAPLPQTDLLVMLVGHGSPHVGANALNWIPKEERAACLSAYEEWLVRSGGPR